MIAVRVRDEHERRTARRGGGKRIEVRGVADTGINQDRIAIADQVGPVPLAGHRARIGRVQELRIHPATPTGGGAPSLGRLCRSKTNDDTAKANIINAAALMYGVVMP